MQQITNQRIAYLDTMRVVATFGVIALHVFCTDYHSTIGSYNWFVAVIVDTLVRWSVPLFVMISGALFLQPSKEVSYRTLLKKQIPRLFIAYVFWGIVYGLIMTARSKMSSCDFKLEAVIPHFHLWQHTHLGIGLTSDTTQRQTINQYLHAQTLGSLCGDAVGVAAACVENHIHRLSPHLRLNHQMQTISHRTALHREAVFAFRGLYHYWLSLCQSIHPPLEGFECSSLRRGSLNQCCEVS